MLIMYVNLISIRKITDQVLVHGPRGVTMHPYGPSGSGIVLYIGPPN